MWKNRYTIQINKKTFILTILAFIILNFFLAFFINIQNVSKKIKSDYFLTADFKKDTPDSEKEKLESELWKLKNVKKIKYVSREEAFQKVQTELNVVIPKSENSLSDTLIIYFSNPTEVSKLQDSLDNNQYIRDISLDAEYINLKEREARFYNIVSIGVVIVCILPILGIVYATFYTSVSIEFLNNVDIISNDKVNEKRSKSVNLLPFSAASIIGTLIFLNAYIYFRNHLLKISYSYLLLSLKELIFFQLMFVLVINILIWVLPVKIKVIKRDEN